MNKVESCLITMKTPLGASKLTNAATTPLNNTPKVAEERAARFEEYMPRYFRATQFSSIVRQFCHYEIVHQWVLPDKCTMILSHPLFTSRCCIAPQLKKRLRYSSN